MIAVLPAGLLGIRDGALGGVENPLMNVARANVWDHELLSPPAVDEHAGALSRKRRTNGQFYSASADSGIARPDLWPVHLVEVRVPGDADQRSELMSITVPK